MAHASNEHSNRAHISRRTDVAWATVDDDRSPSRYTATTQLSAICYKLLRLLDCFWSEWQDLNLRPPRPERGALPDCATLRLKAGLIAPASLNASSREAMTAEPATRTLKANREAIEAAARSLASGGLVAFPPPTVHE